MKEIKRNSDKAPSVDKVLRSWEQKGWDYGVKTVRQQEKKATGNNGSHSSSDAADSSTVD